MRLDDPAVVRRQYATEDGLSARRAIYRSAVGDDPRELAFAAVAETAPGRVLEVGCGLGEAAAKIQAELGARVVAVDLSPRMVELARSRGVDARVGDVQGLPFEAGSFHCVLAAWVLFHAADLERALVELARVLRPGGRLVAVTNAAGHLRQLWELVGAEPYSLSFSSENGADTLGRHFRSVERRDAAGTVTLTAADDVRAYLASSERGKPFFVDRVPELPEPLVVGTRASVFVAET